LDWKQFDVHEIDDQIEIILAADGIEFLFLYKYTLEKFSYL
jgi:hypothetical protein